MAEILKFPQDAHDAELERLGVAAQQAATKILAALNQLDRDIDPNDFEPGFTFEMVWVVMAEEDEETAQLFRDTSDWEA